MAIRYSNYLPGSIYFVNLIFLNCSFIVASFFHCHNILPKELIELNVSWLIISGFAGLHQLSRPLNFADHCRKIAFAVIPWMIINLTWVIHTPIWIYGYGLFSALLLSGHYLLFIFLHFLRKRGFNLRHIIVIGEPEMYKRITSSFKLHPEYGYHILGFMPEIDLARLSKSEIESLLIARLPEEIFICSRAANKYLVNCLIAMGDKCGIKITIVTDHLLKDRFVNLINCNHPSLLHLVDYPSISRKSRVLKRSFDVFFSSVVMLGGLPVFFLLYSITRLSSKGPAFYKQERIGKNGKPFYIYKFRSMYINAEQNGPQLSSKDDPRITPWGRVIRRTRLDELPQFWNVFKGDMAVVGYRPERRHFIEKIVEKTPNYKRLIGLKPGITSMGQVEFGYAENVDEMCARLRYDLIYLQRMNLNTDLRIILQTVKVMAQGRGK